MVQQKHFPKWINILFVYLQKIDWRGKHTFYQWLNKHYSEYVIVHDIHTRNFSVPVGEWCFWLECGPENYYLEEFVPFCDVLNALNEPFTLFDLGADIGTVTSLVSCSCAKLKNVVAIEPNPKSFDILQSNLNNLTLPSQCINAAVSNFNGKASFYADPNRINDHEGYIDGKVDEEGDTLVISLDHYYQHNKLLPLEDNVVMKIDVEGQEIQTLQGAESLLKNAIKVVLLIEIHPDVLARTEESPEDLFAEAEKIRAFKWIVPLQQNLVVDRNEKFFNQVPHGQYDIIGVSN